MAQWGENGQWRGLGAPAGTGGQRGGHQHPPAHVLLSYGPAHDEVVLMLWGWQAMGPDTLFAGPAWGSSWF